MYSPQIYENQVPCLYHAAQNLNVPMTQLANAFVYYGLIAGSYGVEATDLIPQPNQVVPTNVTPKMQIFNPQHDSIRDYMNSLPIIGTVNPFFQTLDQIVTSAPVVGEDENVPF